MEVDFAILAEVATIDQANRLNVLGAGFDLYSVPEVPATLKAVAFVMRLKIHPTESGREHALEIELWGPDGTRVAQISARFSVSRRDDDPTRPIMMPMVLDFRPLVFPTVGTHEFHVIVDGTHLKAVPLHVQLLPSVEPTDGEPPGPDEAP